MIMKANAAKAAKQVVAIYCRQSVSDATEEFDSVKAQRESIERYIQSQRAHGWVPSPETYNDTNASGANLMRPGFKKLLKDIEAGKVQIVAVYKIDRLSRSLLDFTATIQMFDQRGVSFVSTTQQFTTTTPEGRMTMNILATFAQFEREMISQRTKDKMLASRKRGMFTGGRALLGYDVKDGKLVVNVDEAKTAREIFDLYLSKGSLLATANELAARNIRNKSYTTRAGKRINGCAFTKTTLQSYLRNPVLAGLMRCGEELVKGQHEAIINIKTFEAVGALLSKQSRRSGDSYRREVLLRGLIKCGRCNSTWSLHETSKRGAKTHRYYECQKIQKLGAGACRGSRCNAEKLEEAIVSEVVAQVEAGKLTLPENVTSDPGQDFAAVWAELFVAERARILQLAIERIVVNAETAEFQITFRDHDARDSRKNEPAECQS